jgi:hypothetical protein
MARTFVIGLLAIWTVQIGACVLVVVTALVKGKLRLRSLPGPVALHGSHAASETRASDLAPPAFAQARGEERLPSDERPTERPEPQRRDSDHVPAR